MSRIGRTRRTRVYDCNYNKGESYYRPVLDRLDGKLPTAREPDRERIRSDVESRIRSLDEDVSTSAQSAAADLDFFDSRGARAQRGRPLASAYEEDDLTDDITESLKRLRAGKKASRFAEDIDFENSVANLENRVRISDKILESVGVGSEMSSARRALQENEERTEKRIARRINDDGAITKWTALSAAAEEESAASARARASRARLSDLEDEMNDLTERSAAREKRAARLRALVADTDAESSISASKITIRAEREKKQVTF